MLVVVLVYQQLENNILTPKIQGKAVNLSAFFIIIAVTLFGALLGVLGALTAVPLAAMIQIVVQEVTTARREQVAEARAASALPGDRARVAGSRPRSACRHEGDALLLDRPSVAGKGRARRDGRLQAPRDLAVRGRDLVPGAVLARPPRLVPRRRRGRRPPRQAAGRGRPLARLRRARAGARLRPSSRRSRAPASRRRSPASSRSPSCSGRRAG